MSAAVPGPVRPVQHLHQAELARRWRVSPRKLERWRWRGQGPCYLKIGGRVVYRLDDVETFEASQAHEAAVKVVDLGAVIRETR